MLICQICCERECARTRAHVRDGAVHFLRSRSSRFVARARVKKGEDKEVTEKEETHKREEHKIAAEGRNVFGKSCFRGQRNELRSKLLMFYVYADLSRRRGYRGC